MRKSYVYKITCLVTSEYYFGSSFRAKSDRYWGTGRKIKERISQYGKENFIKEILGEFEDRTIAHQVENQYIEQFRHDDKCLNIACDHKFGTYGEESRAKMSAAQRGEKNHNFGKHCTKETRAKLSAVLRGKHRTEETRAKISAAKRGENHPMFGKHLSDDTRAKMSAAKRGEKNSFFGKHHTEKSRSKISAANRGKHRTEETRAKISAAQRGKIVSEETRAKISAARRGENHPMYGKHLSDDTRAKLSAARLGKPHPHGKHWRKNKITGKREYYD